MIAYTESQVNQMANLLNKISVTGIENAKRVAIIAELLNSGKETTDDNSTE